jgi:hypothetical protein
MVNLSKILTPMEGQQVLNSKTMAHHSQKKLLIGSLLYTRLVSTVAPMSIMGFPEPCVKGEARDREHYPHKPAYSVIICNSACAWDKEVASLHLGYPNVPSNRPGMIRPMTGVYNFYLSNFSTIQL